MKILHTGDWHIGKRLNGVDMIEDQRHMLDQLLDHIDESSVDLVVVAGDVFDRSNPSQSALKLVNEYLYRINIEKGIPVLAISGNHDSRSRLDYGSYWFEKSNYHMRTSLEDITTPVVIDDHHFYMVPHMDVLEAKVFFDDDSIRSHHDVYKKVTEEIATVMDKDAYNVMIGHMFISNGKASDSERPLSIGLSEEVGADLFEAFDLVLLGHLHHPFAITHERIFYSGSLLKYSFSEVKQPKGFRMVETDNTKCRFIPLHQQRDLVHYQGTFEEVINETVMFEDKAAYFKFELSGMSHINDPMAKLKMIYPNVMELRPLVEKREHVRAQIDVHQSSDREIFESFIESVHGEPLTEYQGQIFNTYFKGDADEADSD
ncbi:exonuclease SbcCD subunit D [Salinicoccus hispanicus]|uniref:Nuclease SbcCD subunit D n=1 Tax=Salinicoccus hispanicus TaxID=157225 RepID=A0A6N8TZ26_9STAP|nr:exonuclease SbcCD subunit D [Salinicoccus hispanicus]MXQ49956.1 exonuclease subunit SbcD [Salinicoccus hispanicus]